jgi:methyl-accepting chemotaxis protein
MAIVHSGPVRRRPGCELTITQQLGITAAVLVTLVGATSVASLVAVHRLGARLDTAFGKNVRAADLLGLIGVEMRVLKGLSSKTQFDYVAERVLVADPRHNITSNLGPCGACHSVGDPSKRRSSFDAVAAAAASHAEQLGGIVSGKPAQESLHSIRSGIAEWQQLYADYLALTRADDFHEAHGIVRDRMQPLLARVDAARSALEQDQQLAMTAARKSAAESISRMRWTAIALVVFACLCGAGSVAAGIRIKRQLREISAQLGQRARRVAEDAGLIRSAGDELARAATEQAASIEETSAASREINGTAADNSKRCSTATELVAEVLHQTELTQGVLADTTSAMEKIDASSNCMSAIIKTVNDIAFQTNILALNAAIEAARAGHSGVAFAVVADEVRNLAGRCTQAARETGELIEQSLLQIREGKLRLSGLASGIHSISESAHPVGAIANEVRVGSQAQARSLAEIGTSLETIEQVTQTTAAGAEQAATISEKLASEATALEEAVVRLNALVGAPPLQHPLC